MALITRQDKGSKLTIEEMDDNLLYLQSLSGNTGFTQAKIGTETDYSLFDLDGSLRFFGNATTFNDQPVDILTEVVGNPLTARMFRNNGAVGTNYAQDYYSNNYFQYSVFDVSGYTNLTNAILNSVFSISFWVFPEILGENNVIFSLPNSAHTDIIFSISLYGNKARVQHYNISTVTSNSMDAGSWYHICYTQHSNTNATLYLNNIGTHVFPLPLSLSDLNSLGLIGCGLIAPYYEITNYVFYPCYSSVSNLRMYNIALNDNQISELFNIGLGLSVELHPSGITEATDVLYNFKNLESYPIVVSGVSYITNSSTLGAGKNLEIIFYPNFISGPIGAGSHGVFLPAFDAPRNGALGGDRHIRFEMSHEWKTGSPITLHMHISTNIPILSGQTIIFTMERTFQDIYGVLSNSSLDILNPSLSYPQTTTSTHSFSPQVDIPAYSNLILDFGTIDMSQYHTTSTSGMITITRDYGTFTGFIFEVQSIRMHYQIDSVGSRTLYVK